MFLKTKPQYSAYFPLKNAPMKLSYNVPRLQEVANFGTNYFLLKIKILAKRERELTTKFAISCNRCYAFVLMSVQRLLFLLYTF